MVCELCLNKAALFLSNVLVVVKMLALAAFSSSLFDWMNQNTQKEHRNTYTITHDSLGY